MSAGILAAGHRVVADREGRCPAHDADVCEVCPGATLARKLAPMVEIGERVRDQDNLATSHPVFVVFEKERIWGEFEEPAGVGWFCDGERVHDLAESLEVAYRVERIVPSGYQRRGYVEVDRFATACFTRDGCEDYLRQNGHNLKSPRIYVASGYRNDEWQAARAFLLSLAGPKDEAQP